MKPVSPLCEGSSDYKRLSLNTSTIHCTELLVKDMLRRVALGTRMGLLLLLHCPIALFTVDFAQLYYTIQFCTYPRQFASTLDYIVMKMRKTNREKGYFLFIIQWNPALPRQYSHFILTQTRAQSVNFLFKKYL